MGQGNNLNRSTPVLDFTSMDASDLIQDLVAYAKANYSESWTDFNPLQFAMALVELQAYQFDMTQFNLNALINEVFVTTAIRRNNILAKAKEFDYEVPGPSASTVVVRLELDPGAIYPQTLLATTHRVSTGDVVFHPVSDVVITAADAVVGYVDVTFAQGEPVVGEYLGDSIGAAGQRFRISQKPIVEGSLVVTVAAAPWAKEGFMIEMGAAEDKYLIEVDDVGNTYVIFGDGEYGRIPTMASAIVANYTKGGGSAGRVGAGTIIKLEGVPSCVLSCTNPLKATGGDDGTSTRLLRLSVPLSMRAKNGAINGGDVAAAAITVPGVGKVRAVAGDPLTRQVLLYLAPSGGGYPTDTLKTQVINNLREPKMLGLRVTPQDPVYKNLRISLLAHANPGVRKADVKSAIETSLINTSGSGAFDFDQVDFGGVDEYDQPTASIDYIDDIMDGINSVGFRRVEYLGLDVLPEARSLRNNAGNGTVTAISNRTSNTRRREWVIHFLTSTTFEVYERIVGMITQISDSQIIDDRQTFPEDVFVEGFATLRPDRRFDVSYNISDNTETAISTTLGGLFLSTEESAEYYIERRVGLANGTVGVPYGAVDVDGNGVLDFTVNAGTNTWVSGDELLIDTYPPSGDVTLRDDEIPVLLSENLNVRVAGGIEG